MKKAQPRKATKAPVKTAPTNTWMIHEKALKEFERGVGLLQKQSYSEALERFQSIVGSFPQEKELTDRANVYLRICQNLLDRKDAQPRRPEDLCYYGGIRPNDAHYEE